MDDAGTPPPGSRARELYFFTHPGRWPAWPFLPVVRRAPGREDELGVLVDLRHATGRTGYSATVFLSNLFLLPATEAALLALPREAFDTPEEVYAAGWRVD